ncbi:hypothetical protein DXG03_007999, partial [Asterophora parasitica]
VPLGRGHPVAPEASLATLVATSLPSSIWDADSLWVALSVLPDYKMENFTQHVYDDATRGSQIPPLRVQGNSFDEMVDKLSVLIDKVVESKDFMVLLSSKQHFAL